jgi:hypothetical protein
MSEGKATGPERVSPGETSSSISVVSDGECCGSDVQTVLKRVRVFNGTKLFNGVADRSVRPRRRDRSSGIGLHRTAGKEEHVQDQYVMSSSLIHGNSRPSKRDGSLENNCSDAILV